MALLRVLAFDPEGRPVAFDTWHDDLQLYLLRDSKDSVSLFDHVSGVAPAPPPTADGATRSQWLSRDAAARLAIRNHLPVAECTHFGQHRTAQAVYDAFVARYSSPATAALGHLLLPYMFPELLAFATVADLVTHLRTSDARYRATVPSELLVTNQPPMFITLYFIVSRLPASLYSVRNHFLSLDPTSLTADLLEQHLLAAETSAVAVGAACGTPRSSFIEGCSPSPLSPSFASTAAADVSVTEDVGATSTSAKRCSSKGKGGRGGAKHRISKLSTRAIPCVFLGFVPDAPGWQFYHPTSRRVLPSHDVTFDKPVPFYRLFPYRSAPPPPPPLFLAPGPPPVDPLLPQGPAPSGVSQVDPLPGTAPVQVAVGSGAALGATSGDAASGGAEPGGAGSEGAGSWVAELGGVEPGGAESEGAESGGAAPRGATLSGGPAGASPRLSSQQLREWLVRRAHRWSGAPGAGGAGDTGAGGAAVTTGAGGTGSTTATGPRGVRTKGAGAAGTGGVGCAEAGDPTEPGAVGARGAGAGVGGPGAGGAGAAGAGVGGTGAGGAGATGAGAVDTGAGGAGGSVPPRPYFVPLLQQILGPASPLPAPSPYTDQSGGLTERREPSSHPVSPVRTAHRAPCSRPPLLPVTHTMAHCPSFVPLRVPLPAPPESSLSEVSDPASDRARAASPTVSRLLATAVTDPSFLSTAPSALVAELLDFAAACRLDYVTSRVVESVSATPPSVRGECALSTDVFEDEQEDFECLAVAVPHFASMLLAPEGDPDAPDIPTPCSYAEAITGPYSSHWQAAMDAEMASWKSKGTYVDEVPPSRVNIVDGMWIFRVKRPPGSLPAFKARYIARGFSQ
ncbi:unnamed protein product [Closterium sp. NIES-54]